MFDETLYDTLPDLFYAVDSEWRTRRWNDRLRERTGYTDEEIAEMHPLEFLPEEERERMVAEVKRVFERRETRTHESYLLTKDGERIPYEFNGSPIVDETGTVIGLAGTGRDISERKAREQELRQYETVFETIDDGVYAFDTDLRFTAVNEAFVSMTGYDRDRLLGAHVSLVTTEDGFDRASELAVEMTDGKRDVAAFESDLVRKDGSTVPTETRFTFLPDESRSAVGVVRDVTERRERERALRHRRDELETLNRINVIIRELVRALASTATREEVEQTVCAHLADSELYQFAWIGERDRSTGGIERRTQAGIDDGTWETIEAGTEDGDWERPASVVLQNERSTVVDDIESDTRYPASVRAALEDTSVQSGIAIPLSHGKATYGVLVVYATRQDAFSEREAAGFDALGELVGFVIDAVESKRLLLADRVVELEFQVTDDDSFFVSLSKQFDTTCVLEEAIPARDGALLEYLRVDGVQADEVLKLAERWETIHHVRRIEDDLFEVTVTEQSPVLSLVAYGASITTASAERGRARIVVELPPDTDVRSVVETLGDTFPDSELVGKRERERADRLTEDVRGELERNLTERQLAALRTAYVAGYFGWPRGSTAEEVADALGVTSATFHQHIRKAEQKLLSVFLGENPARE
ncbi:bacterio-opsin activator domain-containing protein [Haladaptatus sp. NG-WS-4]